MGEKDVPGIHVNSTAHNVVLRKLSMMNNCDHATDAEYWKGDGFTTGRGVYNVRFENVTATNNTDGDYDIESSNMVLVRAFEGTTHDFRLWTTSATIENVTSVDATYYGGPGRATHVWLADGAQAAIKDGKITEPNPVRSIFQHWHRG
ncbi:hypothetical protein DC522_20880 [Microvirga sp. KLBC 81]|uniref:hypothetical protein n=1 Tax=Microvirga sp. KLBC 81 TaxID=1862707 RepID=UPI000D525614|nr:hypothetical protein [Microvirga sp. KLBC 81]PVE22451.1 hypothetical protein DC522_20880 [Microvirga sp. KLBC 81]